MERAADVLEAGRSGAVKWGFPPCLQQPSRTSETDLTPKILPSPEEAVTTPGMQQPSPLQLLAIRQVVGRSLASLLTKLQCSVLSVATKVSHPFKIGS